LLLLSKDYLKSASILFEENQYRDSLLFLGNALAVLDKKKLKFQTEKTLVTIKDLEKAVQKNDFIFPEDKIEVLATCFVEIRSFQKTIKKSLLGISFWDRFKQKLAGLMDR
jgi:hypothetical protein